MALSPRARRIRDRSGSLVALLLAVVFVGLVTYLPHMQTAGGDVETSPWVRLADAYQGWWSGERDDYEYPMHVDENVHWVRMASLQRADSLHYPNPYTGGGGTGEIGALSFGFVHETGFHVAFAQFQEMTGIPWIQLIRFAPALWAGLTATLLWSALRPWPGAAVAAALVALVPTSPRFLGIAFFVPIAMGLAWIVASLALVKWAGRDRGVFGLLLLLTAWSFFIHLIAGFAALLVLALAAVPVARARRINLAGMAVAAAIPVVWFYDGFSRAFTAEAEILGSLPIDFTIFDQLGLPFLFAWGAGCAFMVLRPPKGQARIPILVGTIASVLVFAGLMLNRSQGWDLYALYDRWHQPFALFAAVPVAYLVVEVPRALRDGLASHLGHRRSFRPWVRRFAPGAVLSILVGPVVIGGAVAAVVDEGLDYHLRERYYYVINDQDWALYHSMVGVGPPYEVFVTHPWKAPVVVALTGMQPFTWLDPGSPPKNWDAYVAYLRTEYENPVWLVDNDISVIVDIAPAPAPYERQPSGAYLLDPDVAEVLYRARHPSVG